MPRVKVRLPMRSRPLVLAALLVLSMSLAGCSASDWYNQRGTIRVELAVMDTVPEDLNITSRIDDFQQLRITLRGAQVRQELAANPISSPSVADVKDAVAMAKSGERVRLLEEKVSLRGFQQVVVRLEALDGITATGEAIPGCERGVAVEEPPCIRYDRSGAYSRNLVPADFAAPRGGTMTIVLPVGVGFNPQLNEYFIFSGLPYRAD